MRKPEFITAGTQRLQVRQSSPEAVRYGARCAEKQNKTDSCPAQVLRALSVCADAYGPQVTMRQVPKALAHLCVSRFGSFNKAKQMAGLVANPHMVLADSKYARQLLIEDMCAFKGKYARWPIKSDYQSGLMLCSVWCIRGNGGLKKLRQEAMNLLEERQAQAQRVNSAIQKIEMELAGTARR